MVGPFLPLTVHFERTSIESERSRGSIVDGRAKVDAELNGQMVVKSPVLEEWTISFDRF